MNNIHFRKAISDDSLEIWKILQHSIERRRIDGSKQWQDGYPNLNTVVNDIQNEVGFVLTVNGEIASYAAVILNNEPAYDDIEGRWLSDGDFLVVHRVAVSDNYAGRGYVKEIFNKIEEYAASNGVSSIKVDTNFDNGAMLHILKNLGYIYCGEVYFRGSARKAFEKILL